MTDETTKQIVFVLYPGLTPLDLVGPLQALSAVPQVDPYYEVMVVAETLDAVLSDSIISLAPSHTFDDAPSPFAIVVPGGGARRSRAAGTSPLSTTSPRPARSRHRHVGVHRRDHPRERRPPKGTAGHNALGLHRCPRQPRC